MHIYIVHLAEYLIPAFSFTIKYHEQYIIMKQYQTTV